MLYYITNRAFILILVQDLRHLVKLGLAPNVSDAVEGLLALFSSPTCSLDMSQEDDTQIADLSGLADPPDDANFRALEAAHEEDDKIFPFCQVKPLPEL